MAITWVLYLAMFPMWIIGIFAFKCRALYLLYCSLGLLFYSIYLIIDTMMLIGGKSAGGYAVSLDDYIVGALMLYLDIIMIFVYILRIIGAARD